MTKSGGEFALAFLAPNSEPPPRCTPWIAPIQIQRYILVFGKFFLVELNHCHVMCDLAPCMWRCKQGRREECLSRGRKIQGVWVAAGPPWQSHWIRMITASATVGAWGSDPSPPRGAPGCQSPPLGVCLLAARQSVQRIFDKSLVCNYTLRYPVWCVCKHKVFKSTVPTLR